MGRLRLIMVQDMRSSLFIPVVLVALLAACQSTPVGVTGTAPSLPALPSLPPAGAVHYAVDSNRSDVRFLVYKAGALSSFGHDHVIAARGIQGDVYVAPVFTDSGFTLTLQVRQFQVDLPELRAMEGPDFAKQPSPQAVAGTLSNMLGTQELDAEHYPEVHIRSVKLVGPEWGPDLTVRIGLHGVERDIMLPVAIERQDDTLTVTGSFNIRQTDFGITPLSILGGGIQVADSVRIRFRIVARKAS